MITWIGASNVHQHRAQPSTFGFTIHLTSRLPSPNHQQPPSSYRLIQIRTTSPLQARRLVLPRSPPLQRTTLQPRNAAQRFNWNRSKSRKPSAPLNTLVSFTNPHLHRCTWREAGPRYSMTSLQSRKRPNPTIKNNKNQNLYAKAGSKILLTTWRPGYTSAIKCWSPRRRMEGSYKWQQTPTGTGTSLRTLLPRSVLVVPFPKRCSSRLMKSADPLSGARLAKFGSNGSSPSKTIWSQRSTENASTSNVLIATSNSRLSNVLQSTWAIAVSTFCLLHSSFC